DHFRSIPEPIEKALRDPRIYKGNVHEIFLVGDSIRIPRIVKLTSDFPNGKEPNKLINLAKSVAHGIAVQAAIRSDYTSEKTQDLLIFDDSSLCLSLDSAGGVTTTLIQRNAVVPAKKSNIFWTYLDSDYGVFI
ncbi:hypothetical protein EIP86_000547, partial [Pleurotus ostreatoroseus]